jgi:hypothetical protein
LRIPNPEFEDFYRRKMLEIVNECEARGVPEFYFLYNMVVMGLTSIKANIGEIGYHDVREEIEKIVSDRARRSTLIN